MSLQPCEQVQGLAVRASYVKFALIKVEIHRHAHLALNYKCAPENIHSAPRGQTLN